MNLMSAIHLTAVGFARPGRAPLFESIDLHLDHGWTGVVGPNGGGKTTLIELLAGRLRATDGRIKRSPAGLTVAVCAQRVDDRTPEIEAFSWDWSRAAVRLRATLGLDPDALARWPTLSPGERKRWQLGAALIDEPGALLLDEPSNHLDAEGRRRLRAALSRYDGVGVMVSHDRALLDALTRRTVWIEPDDRGPSRVECIAAPYSEAAAERQRLHSTYVAELTAAQVAARALRRRAGLERQARAEATARHRKAKRDRKDHDARSSAAKGRAAFGLTRSSRRSGQLGRDLARAEAGLRDHRLRAERGRALFVEYAPAPLATLVVLDRPAIRAGDAVLLRDVRLSVGRADRIRVTGANGAGKTTLLHALRDAAPPRSRARCLWVPQHLPAEVGPTAVAEVRAMPPAKRQRVLHLVAALGVDPARLMASPRPSPGETRTLVLARGLARDPWWVMLDEPANHLDLPARERLQAALAAWPGALVLVSHDAAFAEALTTAEWRVESGRARASTG